MEELERKDKLSTQKENGFGEAILRRRKALGLTQAQVAKKIGVQSNYIVYLEKGQRRPSDGILMKVAEVLGLPAAELHLMVHPNLREIYQIAGEAAIVPSPEPLGGFAELLQDIAVLAEYGISEELVRKASAFVRREFPGRSHSKGEALRFVLAIAAMV